MRDILKDLEQGRALSNPDPIRRAQIQMRPARPRRFYKDVSVARDGDGHVVHLDGRSVRTPAAAVLRLPTEAAAALVATEYDAQQETIEPVSMPVTRLVNTAIDGVATDVQAVVEDLLRYASSDLLCYRAESPQELVERQAEAWDPVLDWAHSDLGARFILAEGVMHVEQPRESIGAIGVHLGQNKEPFRLAALHVMTTLMGSVLLALAVERRAVDAVTAWNAAHVDEDWNIHQWGEDAEAAAHRAARKRDMMGAVALMEALDG